MIRRPPRSTRTDTLFPYTTLFRSERVRLAELVGGQVITNVKLPCSFPTTHPLFIGETGWKLSEPILKRLKDSDAVLRPDWLHLDGTINQAFPPGTASPTVRPEERRGGTGCLRTCQSWWFPYHY